MRKKRLSNKDWISTWPCCPGFPRRNATIHDVFPPRLCGCNEIIAPLIKSRKAKVAPLLPIPFLINFSLLYFAYCPGVHPNSSRGDSAKVYFQNSSSQAHGAWPCSHSNKQDFGHGLAKVGYLSWKLLFPTKEMLEPRSVTLHLCPSTLK